MSSNDISSKNEEGIRGIATTPEKVNSYPNNTPKVTLNDRKMKVESEIELNYERALVDEELHPEFIRKAKILERKFKSKIEEVELTLELSEKNYADILTSELNESDSIYNKEIQQLKRKLKRRTRKKRTRRK
mmetsp:Transcript_7621/g.10705  ORF Transcript_7621/g.10705 Transcript_7621/m.10705 type:complete len:132 (+) Transcript_7621:7-402(+)